MNFDALLSKKKLDAYYAWNSKVYVQNEKVAFENHDHTEPSLGF